MVVPLALMTAELSTMMNENGGYIVWVNRAFGPLVSWMFSFNILLVNLFDMAIYPVLFIDYIAQLETSSWWVKLGVKAYEYNKYNEYEYNEY
jgi:amino acid transporter